MSQVDLAIVGAGPAGLAAAIAARHAGLSTLVLERRQPPLDKACGEGLMPAGARLLEALGVQLPALRHSAFAGVCFVDGPRRAEGRVAGVPGRGIRRTALAEALRRRATELGVELRFGCAATAVASNRHGVELEWAGGAVAARWLVAADGLHSPLRRQLGLDGPRAAARRFGVRRHFAVRPWSELVEVHFGAGAEAYVTPVGDEVSVALLFSERAPGFDALLAGFPELAARLAGARTTSEARGAGPFLQQARRIVDGRVVLLGDAAGYVDAITGEGLTLALRSAVALVEILRREAPLGRYEATYRRLRRSHVLLTRLLLWCAARPWPRRRLIEALAAHPALFGRLLELNQGERSLASVAWSALESFSSAGR